MTTSLLRYDRPGLYCLEIRTTNWQQLVEWYRGVLGLRVLVRVTDDGYALLEAGETRIAILSRQSTGEASRRISLAFEVRQLGPVLERLEGAGASMTHPRRNAEGLREVGTHDPDGNRIRLFSWPRGR